MTIKKKKKSFAQVKAKKQRAATSSKIFLIFFFGLILIGGLLFLKYYKFIYGDNVKAGAVDGYLYIPSGSDYDDVLKILGKADLLENLESFEWVAGRMNYANNVYPGKYKLDSKNNRELLVKLRTGDTEDVKLVINNMRTKEQLAGLIGNQLEADSTTMFNFLNDKAYLRNIGFTPETVPAIFLANTYNFKWQTSAKGVFTRMLREYEKFWTEERTKKAEELGLTKTEVMTLASIVQEESNKVSEHGTIAGVYLNRLKKGMKLQADPTVKYAVGDPSLRRILNVHLKVESPYNTYQNVGLPPGPISFPTETTIKAVLDPDNHNYIFFCAKEDFSGYHNFATTLKEHNANARRFRNELNKRKIK